MFDRSNNIGAIDMKMDGSVLEKKSYFKMLELSFSSKLDRGFYISSIGKTASKKLEPWFVLWGFFLLRLLSTICPCMEYYCHAWPGAASCYLELLDKLQKRMCRAVGPIEPLAHRRNVASFSLFYRYYIGLCSSELAQLVLLRFSPGRSTRYSHRLHDYLSPFLDVTKM